jgi:hypothetical protein
VSGTPLATGGGAAVFAVSCAAVSACAAGGQTVTGGDQEPFVVDETSGGWGTARPLQNMDQLNKSRRGLIIAISCGAPGDCVAVGTYLDAHTVSHAFEAEETGGSWGPAQPLPGMDQLTTGSSAPDSVSCSGPGECSIGGSYQSSDGAQQQAFVIDEHGGTWGSAQRVPGSAARNTGHFAGGFYEDAKGRTQGLVANESTATTTRLSLSAATIRLGHEQSERISVRVTGHTGGTPGGTATVKAGTRTVCTIRLAGAKGSCTLRARVLKPGQYQVTAAYGGSPTYAGSRSGARTLTVTR